MERDTTRKKDYTEDDESEVEMRKRAKSGIT